MKKPVSVLLVLTMLFGVLAVPAFGAAPYTYSPSAAICYAAENWDSDPYGYCAEFVSDCLKAGGLLSYSPSTTALRAQMKKNGEGTEYKMKTGGNNIYASANTGHFSVGDPLFFYCPKCKECKHTVLISGVDSSGRITDFAHNNPHNGTRATWIGSCYDCGGAYTVYCMHLNSSDKAALSLLSADSSEAAPNEDITFTGFSNMLGTGFTFRIFNAAGKLIQSKTAAPSTSVSIGTPGYYTAKLTAVNELGTVQSKAFRFSVGLYTIRFSANEGTGAPASQIKTDGKLLTLPKTIPTRSGYDFLGWSTSKYAEWGSYFPGGNFATEGSRTLYAVWAKNPIPAPTLKSISNSKTGIVLKWSKIASVNGYRIYRYGNDKKWHRIGTNSAENDTVFEDTSVKSGLSCRYTVRAYRGSKAGLFDTTGFTCTFLTPPVLSSVGNTVSGALVRWNAVPGADGYRVYQKASSGWKYLGSTAGKNSTSFRVTSAVSGQACVYTVVATRSRIRSSFDSSGISHIYLAPPIITAVSNGKNGAVVKWNAISGAEGYEVYRREGSGKWVRLYLTGSTSYTDTAAESGKNYTYTIRAYNGNNRSSYNAGKANYYLAAPSLTSATAGKSGITIRYKSVPGAEGYIIYRKTSSGGYHKLTVVKGNKTSLLDKTAVIGQKSTYTVRAYKGDVKSGYNSAGITAKR